jgi:hypothetical protein
VKSENDEMLFELVVRGSRARDHGAWELVGECALAMAPRVPPAVELLARFVADLVDDEDFDLASVVWTKLVTAVLPPQVMQLAASRAAQPAS